MRLRRGPPVLNLDFRPSQGRGRRWLAWGAAITVTGVAVLMASHLPDPESELAHAAANPLPPVAVRPSPPPVPAVAETGLPASTVQPAASTPDFTVVGVVGDQGRHLAVIDRGGDTVVLAAGQNLGAAYRIERVDDSLVVVRHRPSGHSHRYRLVTTP